MNSSSFDVYHKHHKQKINCLNNKTLQYLQNHYGIYITLNKDYDNGL